MAAVAFRFNPETRWDFGDGPYSRYDGWPVKRVGLVDELVPGLPVIAWQSGKPGRRGIRAVGRIEGAVEGPLEEADMPVKLAKGSGWRSVQEYRAVWLGALRLPIRWFEVFPQPLSADQAPVCRPIPQAPNPFPVTRAEWEKWRKILMRYHGPRQRLV